MDFSSATRATATHTQLRPRLKLRLPALLPHFISLEAMSQPIKSRTKASSTNGIKKSSARRPTPAFTVYRDEPEQPVLVAPTAAHLDPAQVFIPGNSGRHSPTLFTKKGRESIKAMKQAGRTNALPLPNLPALNKHTTVTDKKRKSRRFLNPRIAGDEIDIDMMDMEGFSDVSSWGSATRYGPAYEGVLPELFLTSLSVTRVSSLRPRSVGRSSRARRWALLVARPPPTRPPSLRLGTCPLPLTATTT
ncbi:hypothetical protein FA95DRAFT_785266 [Auriscalpium vulgare]|uniref:Uncharacterized protein n=1 Tax=Auriscalpium vulgare TaxID=40419 RepID=A0ACB8RBE9_9AGAM|nr:hypothetical protein FA95DRAFT_785266 [Auriscalpium vulgare]